MMGTLLLAIALVFCFFWFPLAVIIGALLMWPFGIIGAIIGVVIGLAIQGEAY